MPFSRALMFLLPLDAHGEAQTVVIRGRCLAGKRNPASEKRCDEGSMGVCRIVSNVDQRDGDAADVVGGGSASLDFKRSRLNVFASEASVTDQIIRPKTIVDKDTFYGHIITVKTRKDLRAAFQQHPPP